MQMNCSFPKAKQTETRTQTTHSLHSRLRILAQPKSQVMDGSWHLVAIWWYILSEQSFSLHASNWQVQQLFGDYLKQSDKGISNYRDSVPGAIVRSEIMGLVQK